MVNNYNSDFSGFATTDFTYILLLIRPRNPKNESGISFVPTREDFKISWFKVQKNSKNLKIEEKW